MTTTTIFPMNTNDYNHRGVPDSHFGLLSGHHARTDELNDRVYSRNFSDQPLPPNFDPRPTPTKYSRFPMIERRSKDVQVPLEVGTPYQPSTNFADITGKAPVGFYLANIDTETILQNRHVAYQRHADQGVYVPDSSSDLYGFAAVGRREDLSEHDGLFKRHTLQTTGSKIAHMTGQHLFHNNTRTQLRGL